MSEEEDYGLKESEFRRRSTFSANAGTKEKKGINVLHPHYLDSLLDEGIKYNDPRYRGNIYESRPTAISNKWAAETNELGYLNKIRRSVKAFPDLAHLVSWMEVSTTESRYKYLSQKEHESERFERAHRVRVCQIDLKEGGVRTEQHFRDSQALAEALSDRSSAVNAREARVYVVEDLSRDVIEQLGSAFDVDPRFFLAHIEDYLWYGVTSEAAVPKSLDRLTRKRPYFTMQYLRPRYYETATSFKRAMKEAGSFNVLRQIDSDRSRESVQDDNGGAPLLMRAKASLWVKPRESKEEGVLAMLLIDPTIKEGYRLWNGYTSFENWPHGDGQTTLPEPPRTSLYDDVVYWMTRMTEQDFETISAEPKTCALPAFWYVVSDWHHIIQYVTSQLGKIEWEIEIPALRTKSSIDATMQKLHPWRRNVSLYRAMIVRSIDQLFSRELQRQYEEDKLDENDGLPALLRDFKTVLADIDVVQDRIERIVSVAAALLSIEEGRQAMDQNKNVARLTYLATIFIPLSYVSGFLSMTPTVSDLKQTFWIYFAIAIPLTLIAMVVADFWHISQKVAELVPKRKKKETKQVNRAILTTG